RRRWDCMLLAADCVADEKPDMICAESARMLVTVADQIPTRATSPDKTPEVSACGAAPSPRDGPPWDAAVRRNNAGLGMAETNGIGRLFLAGSRRQSPVNA